MQHTNKAASFAATYALLRAAGAVADHWIQTSEQSVTKGKPGHEGRAACAVHVASYVGAQGLALVAGNRVLGLGMRPSRIAAALLISGATHYIADRRRPLERLAELTGKAEFYHLGEDTVNAKGERAYHVGTGAYQLDQSYHHLFEAFAAIVSTV
ncbi:transcriptional regulator [Kitasatospora sp. NPDC002965]|uniref:transcriptional regulator n=1 Tax=Kitasatospora sp. NPDC002965 TaxID=3154775 RepID=UPI0033BCD191